MFDFSYEILSAIIASLFILLLLIFVGYFLQKEKEVFKKFVQIEKSIEDGNKEIYKIQKWILENEKKMLSQKDDLKINDLTPEIKQLESNLNTIKLNSQNDRDYFENKIIILEEKIHEMRHFGSNFTNQYGKYNEAKILELYKDGYDIEKIARELKIGKGEVEFVLKLSELNK